uniref:ABC transporter domain-containing protein n=1 Tax=Arcella intermedia TaxID=1963864 RepID=A0A6B2L343_9EUKA
MSVPIFLPFLVVILVFFIPFQMKVNTGVIRIERILKSSKPPIFNHFKESIDGMQSIKSYHLEGKMTEKMYQVGDNYVTAYLLKHSFTAWFTTRVYGWGTLITFCLLGCILVVRNVEFFVIDSGLLTLGLIVGLSNTYLFAPFSLAICDVACEMTYTETIRGFFDIEQEETKQDGVSIGDMEKPPLTPKGSSQLSEPLLGYVPLDEQYEEGSEKSFQMVPKDGCEVRFENVWTRYHKDEDPVLKGISFDVKKGEKIGLVGRTGSGKSTILNTILRLQPIDEGQITIGGIPIQNFPLKTLRSSIISIIPQIPVIFKDTLRKNLDPFGEYSDNEILEVLKLVHLKQFSNRSSLDRCIEGSKLSIGERQLLCLARAILKKCPLVLLDEPTASLDLDTANLVKEIIDEYFQERTLFFVAHHLHLVMNLDKIIVFQKGQIIEFDSVSNLIKKKGLFYDMVMSTGPQTSQKLIQMVKQH